MAIESISNVNMASSCLNTASDAASVQSQRQVDISEVPVKSVSERTNIQRDDSGENSQSDSQASTRTVEDAIKRVNNKMTRTHCEFSYNEDVNRVSITVYDSDTDKVIREIPPEESLKMIQKLWEIAGIMVDEKR